MSETSEKAGQSNPSPTRPAWRRPVIYGHAALQFGTVCPVLRVRASKANPFTDQHVLGAHVHSPPSQCVLMRACGCASDFYPPWCRDACGCGATTNTTLHAAHCTDAAYPPGDLMHVS